MYNRAEVQHTNTASQSTNNVIGLIWDPFVEKQVLERSEKRSWEMFIYHNHN